MKQRVISGAIGIVLLVIILCFYDTAVLTAALALLSGIAVYEVLVSTHYLPSKVGGVLAGVFAGVSIFAIQYNMNLYSVMLMLFLVILIACALRFHQTFTFQQLCICAFATLVIPLSFSRILLMDGIIYMILACIAAWVTDMGAYFVGRAFGKKKFAPYISPNKTVGGAIGGLLCTGILFPVACYIYWNITKSNMIFSLWHAVLIGVVCAFAGMMGDLFASVIKRETGIKDFGKIMPGHGGVMDRFDSFLFVTPVLFVLLQILPIFTYS